MHRRNLGHASIVELDGTAPGAWGVYRSAPEMRSTSILSLVVPLLIIASIAAVLGFGGIVGAAVGIAKIVFFVAVVLFLISFIAGGMRGSFSRRL